MSRKYRRLLKAKRFTRAKIICCREFCKDRMTEDEWLDLMDRIAWAYMRNKYPDLDKRLA